MAEKVVNLNELVSGAYVTVGYNETTDRFSIQIGSLKMLVEDWELLKKAVDGFLAELGYQP